MSNTPIDWELYVSVSDNGHFINVRNSCCMPWDESHEWTPDEAEDLADHLRDRADEARRKDPAVREMLSAIERFSEDNPDGDQHDMALYLVRHGYRKTAP